MCIFGTLDLGKSLEIPVYFLFACSQNKDV